MGQAKTLHVILDTIPMGFWVAPPYSSLNLCGYTLLDPITITVTFNLFKLQILLITELYKTVQFVVFIW